MNWRAILYINGVLLSIMAGFMIFPMMADLYFGYDDWKVFFTCIVITLFFGGGLVLSNYGVQISIKPREGFLLINLCWFIVACFGALPFWLSSLNMSVTDSFFESMSGITTTGATVIDVLNYTPAGILLWRALLQWMGGIGIVIMAISILPMLKVGGMQMFSSSISDDDKAVPRTITLIYSICALYLFISVVCTICYMLVGLEVFDAIAHAMTTISTGGFSTYDDSFGHFKTAGPSIIAVIFMTLSGMPFVLFLRAVRGNLRPLYKDEQVRWYLSIIIGAVIITILFLVLQDSMPFGRALRYALFNVVSIISGTGYHISNTAAWNGFSLDILFFLMVLGGCAGSTTCGIRVFRLQVLYAVIVEQMKKLIFPNGVFVVTFNGKRLPASVPSAVMGFLFVYALAFTGLTLALALTGLDVITSISGAAAALSNVGPGFGDVIGPGMTYKPLSDCAKWLLCFGMYLGRLEIFSFLVLLSPHFWRR